MSFGKKLSGRSGCGDSVDEEGTGLWEDGDPWVWRFLTELLVLVCQMISCDCCATMNLWTWRGNQPSRQLQSLTCNCEPMMRKLIRVYCSGHAIACLVGSADYKGIISVYLPNLVPADLPRACINEASVSVGPSSRQIMPLSVSKPASSALLPFSRAGNTPCAVKTVPPPVFGAPRC